MGSAFAADLSFVSVVQQLPINSCKGLETVSHPQFVYFDLGNVLLTFDHSVAMSRVASRTGVSTADVEAAIFQSGLQQDYELGTISSDEFASRVADALKVAIAPNDVWLLCSDIFSLNASIVPIVTHLASGGYPLGILSNTCEAHWKHIENQSYTILRELFPIRVLSYEERLAKPNPEIFRLAADRAGTEIGDILFIDDRPENITGAKNAGMDAVQYHNVPQLVRELIDRDVQTNL